MFSVFYITTRFFLLFFSIAFSFVLAHFIPAMGNLPIMFLVVLTCIVLLDIMLLFGKSKGIFALRHTPERMSNSDQNKLQLFLENHYRYPVWLGIIDEIPFQFQKRDLWFRTVLKPGESKNINYELRPVKRGAYDFGLLNVYAKTPFGLIMRRYRFKENKVVPVYPSYLQMRKYQLLAISNRLSEMGIKKMRRIGNSMEFEQIKEYVKGDDYRTINWKATARRSSLMVNSYTDEKSQQIYCVVNKGRAMKMPFEQLSLLDYAINASLVLSNVALVKQDKAGLITFAEQIAGWLPADKKPTQMNAILEMLYGQKTRYLESDFEALYSHIRTRITHRSLIVLFTNFESLSSLQRELPYLRKIARYHLLLVVFFENTELREVLDNDPPNVEGIYIKTIAEKFAFEKKLIIRELQKYGILSILTAPANVTVNTVNKYLELKTRRLI